MSERFTDGEMNENYQKIEGLLERVRSMRRWRRAEWLLLLGLSAGLALFSLPAIVFPILSGWPRILFRLGFILTAVGAAGVFAFALARGRESLDAAALAVERHNPWLKNSLINAVQLARAKNQSGAAAAFSQDFLAEHLAYTAAGLDRIDLAPALSRAPLKRPAIVAGILAAQLALQLVILPAGRASGAFRSLLTEPWALPQAGPAGPALPLTAGDFTLSYFFPPYSGIEPQKVEHTNGDIAALRGALVTIETRVLEPLQEAAVVTSSGARHEMKVDGGTRLQAELVVSETGTWHIEGVGHDGKRRAEPGSHQIVADDDLAPKIELLLPTADLELAAEGSLEISWSADDDFGLREVAFVYQRDSKEERLLLQAWQDDGRTRLTGDYKLALQEIKAKSGDRIPFCLEAVDNDEVSGGKAGRTPTLVLTVFSARKQHRELLTRMDEFLNLLIDHLAGHIGGELGSRQAAFDLAGNEQKLLAEGLQVVATLSDLLSDLKTDEFAEEIMIDALNDMSYRYPARLAERSAILGKRTSISGAERDQLMTARVRYRRDLENDILFIDKMIKKQRVDDLLSEADDLYKARADLASLLEEYRRTGDPLLLDKLQKTMEELQSAFASLARRMAEMRKELPEEFVNADAMKDANLSDLASEMERLRQALVDGDMESAMAMAEQFLSQMGEWMSQMEKSADQLGQGMSAETMSRINEIEKRLQDMIGRQRGVEDELREIQELAQSRTPGDDEIKRLKSEINQALNTYRQAVDEGQESFMGLNPSPQGKPAGWEPRQDRQRMAQSQRYDQLRSLADQMRRALEDGDLKRAEGLGRQLESGQRQSRQALEEMQEQMDLQPPQRAGACRRAGGRADNALAEAMSKLKSLEAALDPPLDPASQGRLDELGRLQEALRSDVEQTLMEYEELRSQTPSLPGSVSKTMGQASQRMRDASGEMALGEPGRAQAPAADARGSLERAAQGLAQAKQKTGQGMGGSGFGMGMPRPSGGRRDGSRGRMSQERVEIPGQDAWRGPEQYREELLRAMREGSPEAYKNLNRDYYERLVR